MTILNARHHQEDQACVTDGMWAICGLPPKISAACELNYY